METNIEEIEKTEKQVVKLTRKATQGDFCFS